MRLEDIRSLSDAMLEIERRDEEISDLKSRVSGLEYRCDQMHQLARHLIGLTSRLQSDAALAIQTTTDRIASSGRTQR